MTRRRLLQDLWCWRKKPCAEVVSREASRAGVAEIAAIDPDCHFKMPGQELRGREPILQSLAAYRAAFPDMRHTVHHHVESGDTIALEIVVEGTRTGPMQTQRGTVAPTGKRVVWQSCDYIRARGGRAISWHVYHDSVPFLTALGLSPSV